MKHIHPVGSSGNENPPVEPCCLGVDICNFYDIAECPVADWCYVDKRIKLCFASRLVRSS